MLGSLRSLWREAWPLWLEAWNVRLVARSLEARSLRLVAGSLEAWSLRLVAWSLEAWSLRLVAWSLRPLWSLVFIRNSFRRRRLLKAVSSVRVSWFFIPVNCRLLGPWCSWFLSIWTRLLRGPWIFLTISSLLRSLVRWPSSDSLWLLAVVGLTVVGFRLGCLV